MSGERLISASSAGIDVHKKIIWVAVGLPGEASGEQKAVVKGFRTFWRQLQDMATGWPDSASPTR